MNVAQVLQDPINRVPPAAIAAALGASILLLLIACVLLLAGTRTWLGLILGFLALLAAEAALLVVDRQTVSFREGESITVTRPRHKEQARNLARAGMIGLPGVFGLAGLGRGSPPIDDCD